MSNNEQITASKTRKGFFMNEGKMNTKTAIAALALLLPTAAIAESTAANAELTPHEFCTDFAGLAEVIMEKRQDGTPMPAVAEAVLAQSSSGSATDLAVTIAGALILDAYSLPRYNTEKHKQIAIGDFADSAYLSCITVFK